MFRSAAHKLKQLDAYTYLKSFGFQGVILSQVWLTEPIKINAVFCHRIGPVEKDSAISD